MHQILKAPIRIGGRWSAAPDSHQHDRQDDHRPDDEAEATPRPGRGEALDDCGGRDHGSTERDQRNNEAHPYAEVRLASQVDVSPHAEPYLSR